MLYCQDQEESISVVCFSVLCVCLSHVVCALCRPMCVDLCCPVCLLCCLNCLFMKPSVKVNTTVSTLL